MENLPRVIRPAHLPDYGSPPLNEVVLGVQFDQVQGYQQIFAGEVWSLFRDRFPLVQEHPALQPQFETFGPPQRQQVQIPFVVGATHDRFWFLEEGEQELIQFQHDRLLHNWRNRAEGKGKYPHFEPIAESFESELRALDRYFEEQFQNRIQINQCEITYFNHISMSDSIGPSKPQALLKFLRFDDEYEAADFSVNFRRVLRDKSGEPHARLIVEAKTGVSARREPVVVLSLIVRGAPEQPTIDAALDFMKSGRELIVETFTTVTTDAAHALWERIK